MSKLVFTILIWLVACHTTVAQKSELLVRVSELEIHPASISIYKTILKEEAEASVRLEPGVVSIFPMYQQKDSTQVRILEIYANQKAYESHLKTPHFQRYKTTTLSMVKSLKLIDVNALDVRTMTRIFSKLQDKRPAEKPEPEAGDAK